ncbi:MAG: aminopeptidase P family N-terminal domain-containing protein, partial [Rhodanobacter sp.]
MNNSIPKRLAALRAAMQQHGIAAVLVPSADPHLSEYLPAHWSAREWLSGFTGSAGTLIVGRDDAGLWTDSRYVSQAEQQLAGSGIRLMKLRVPHMPEHLEWLQHHLQQGDVLAVAGDSVAVTTRKQIEKHLTATGATVRTDLDLPGAIWSDRPALPQAAVVEHDPAYACIARADKLSRLRKAMHKLGATHHLVSSLDDIAWLTNLRGSDVECNPVFLAHLLVQAEQRATLFVGRAKLNDALVARLAADGIGIADYAAITSTLHELGASDRLLLDSGRVVDTIAAAIAPGVSRIEAANPSTAFKAVKSEAELEHIRDVMRRDGAALVRGFRRLEQRLAAGMTVTELDVDAVLHEERSAQPGWVGESFAT